MNSNIRYGNYFYKYAQCAFVFTIFLLSWWQQKDKHFSPLQSKLVLAGATLSMHIYEKISVLCVCIWMDQSICMSLYWRENLCVQEDFDLLWMRWYVRFLYVPHLLFQHLFCFCQMPAKYASNLRQHIYIVWSTYLEKQDWKLISTFYEQFKSLVEWERMKFQRGGNIWQIWKSFIFSSASQTSWHVLTCSAHSSIN